MPNISWRPVKYLLRIDDVCLGMNRSNFLRLKKLFVQYRIKPLLAVVPSNKDSSLEWPDISEHFNPLFFWRLLRGLQKRGWEIAQHGFEHRLVSESGGILQIQKKSEYAGLPYWQQRQKIELGKRILAQNGIVSDVFASPAHSLDGDTCKALRESGFCFISDGISLFPYKKYGMIWIPQVLWRFWNMPIGILTVCIHPNTLTKKKFIALEKFIKRNRNYIVDFREIRKWCRLRQDFFFIFNVFSWFCWLIWIFVFKLRFLLFPKGYNSYEYVECYQRRRMKGVCESKNEFKELLRKYGINFLDKTVLDLAAGTGVDVLIMHEYSPKKIIWHDKSAFCYNLAKKILKNVNVVYKLADMMELTYPPSSIYFIFCRMGLYYIADQDAFFQKVSFVLEKGGFFYADTYSYRRLVQIMSFRNSWRVILHTVLFFVEFWTGKRVASVAVQSKKQLLKSIKKSGLQLVAFWEEGAKIKLLLQKC